MASEVLGSRTFWIGAAAGAFYKVMGENVLGGDSAETGGGESGCDGMERKLAQTAPTEMNATSR